MMGDNKEQLTQEQSKATATAKLTWFNYAMERFEKHDSASMKLATQKAIECCLNYQNKDFLDLVANAAITFVYFAATFATHPVLTWKLGASLWSLKKVDQQEVTKFFIQALGQEAVWKQTVGNPKFMKYATMFAKGLASEMGLPFPSYREMEEKYIELAKAKGVANPTYTHSLYIDALMKAEIEGFEKAPKRGSSEYKAKWDYINSVLEERNSYVELLSDKEMLSTTLETVQALMTNESINQAVVGYVDAIEGIPTSYKVAPIIEAVLMEGPGFKALAPLLDKIPDIIDKIPAVKNALPDFIDAKEMHEALLKGKNREETFDLLYRLFTKYNDLADVYEGYQKGVEEGNTAVAELIKKGGIGAIWVIMTAHPTLIPYVSKVVEAYFEKNANLTFKEREEAFDKANNTPAYTREMYFEQNRNAKRNLTILLDDPTKYSKQIAENQKTLAMKFEQRKAEYDDIHKDDERLVYTEAMYAEEQKAAQATALSMKEYSAVLKDFAVSPEPIDKVLQALEDEAIAQVIAGAQDPEVQAISQARRIVSEMEFPSYDAMVAKYKDEIVTGIASNFEGGSYGEAEYIEDLENGELPHYQSWVQAREGAYEAQGRTAPEYTRRMYIEEVLELKMGFMITLEDPTYNLAAARHILVNNSLEGLSYKPEASSPENQLLPTFVISLIRATLNQGLDALDPLLAQLPIIASKIPAIQRALPQFIKLDELTAALLGDGVREDTFYLISDLFGQYEYFEKIYAAADRPAAMLDYIKSGKLDKILVGLTTHPTLMAYVVKVVNGYIDTMDLSAEPGNYAGLVIKLLEHTALWDQVINPSDMRPYIISMAEAYLNKVASMSYDQRKVVFDREHKDDKPVVPEYTQAMDDKAKAAAELNAVAYPKLLGDSQTMAVIVGVVQFVMIKHNQDIQNFLSASPSTELLPSALIPVITALIDGDKLEPLIGRLEFIFRTLAPDNFKPDAPEFGEGILDKSLLNLIFNVLEPSKKAETYEFLKVAVGEVNKILAEFKKPFFVAIGGVIEILANDQVLKGFVEANSSVISKIVRYVAFKNFGEVCAKYGIEDKFWGVLDIVLKDLGAAKGILTGLIEIANGENYKTGQGVEKAVESLVRELVNLLNHPKVGPELKQFIANNKGVFISLIDGVLNTLPTAKPYITNYVLGLGLTFSDVLDQAVHNPNDLIKLLDTAKDLGVLRGVKNPVGLGIGAGIAVARKAINREGFGVYSPVVQQVIAEAARPFVPQVVADWTPQWFKNYVPGATATGDRRGAGFGEWILRNINRRPPGERSSLHDILVARAKGDKEVTDEAREFINYNALAKLDFGDEALFLVKYKIDGFSFSGSKAAEIYITDAEISNTNFSNVKAKELIIKDSNLSKVDFTGLGFVKESVGWFYNSMVANPDAVLIIRNTTMDEASFKSLEAAAAKAPFKLELINVNVIKEPVKEVATVSEGEKLWTQCSKECASAVIAHLKTVEFIDEGLYAVEDKDLREFLENVMVHAFSNMPQENLMYSPKINTAGLCSVLRDDRIISSLESVYEIGDDEEVYVDKKYAIKFESEILNVINEFCAKERINVRERQQIEPMSPIQPQEAIQPGEGLGRGIS